jgi:hypothetical protein
MKWNMIFSCLIIKTGGHLALAIKSELLKVNPKLKIFLDVDDLNQVHDLSDNIIHTRNLCYC